MIYSASGQNSISITSSDQIIDGNSSISILNDPNASFTLQDILTDIPGKSFRPLTKEVEVLPITDVQWLSIPIKNTDGIEHELYISLVFTDYIDFYIPSDSGYTKMVTGDMIPLSKRNVPVGQMCLARITIPAGASKTYYARLESTSALSRQFRKVAFRSIKVYTQAAYVKRFETSRIYQSFFYGAIAIMFLYNLFIYFSIRSKSYLVYVGFLFALLLFLTSNNGYIAELFLKDRPTLDLYIRFMSPPILVMFFIFFTKSYLHSNRFAPALNKILNGLIICCFLIPIGMAFGYWYIGRLLVIITALTSFIFILLVSIYILSKGYKPARYFLIANILLIVGAVFYALERYEIVAHNLVNQYSIQLSVVFQSIFFSIGLADRINVIQNQLLLVKLENEQLENFRQLEKQKLTEEKNAELEKINVELDTFIYKTAHDIRGPIARLMGLCNIGVVDVSDPKGREYLGMMKYNADNLNYIVSRISTAHAVKNTEVIYADVNLHKILIDVLSAIRSHEEYAHMAIDLTILEDLNIYTDYTLLRFILLNLIDNGMQFRDRTNDAKSSLKIYTEHKTTETIVYVSDNGIGITTDNAPYIFDMFSKAATGYSSAGLGLYISMICAAKINASIKLIHHANPTIFAVSIPHLHNE